MPQTSGDNKEDSANRTVEWLKVFGNEPSMHVLYENVKLEQREQGRGE